MAKDLFDDTLLTHKDQLIAFMAGGCKPQDQWRIGTEHEKIPFYQNTLQPVPYKGDQGIRALLEAMQVKTGGAPILDKGHIIGLSHVNGSASISLEPGGQFELSGAALNTLHETSAELDQHMQQVHECAASFNIGFLDLAVHPTAALADIPVMPKSRYAIMRRYMPQVGISGRDMMFKTATVQVNLDYVSEADMVQKLRVSLALQPLATALFANSPFTEGKANGYLSKRSEIWRDTDKARSGMLHFAFEDGMGFERYADWALDVPMYFIKRGDVYHDVAGASFRDFMGGNFPLLPKEKPVRSDWINHLSTLFPEVRLKNYLEMRGADAGPLSHLKALPAFWVGLLYDQESLDGAYDLIKAWTAEQRQALRDDVPRLGLHAKIANHSLRDIAKDALHLAQKGLKNRFHLNIRGEDESVYLAPLYDIVSNGRSLAELRLRTFQNEWKNNINPVYQHFIYSSSSEE
jgi:glutamate--cysteine ligase